MSWFNELEEITYEAFEYMPNVGKLYLFKRVHIAPQYSDQKRFWESVVNVVGGAVRDVVLVPKSGEPVPVILVHPMTERLTAELSGILTSNTPSKVTLTKDVPKYDPAVEELVLLAGKDDGSDVAAAQLFFRGAVKGVHYFYDAYFTGQIVHSAYAPKGETLTAHFPEGIGAGARWSVIWRWTSDQDGIKNRPEYSYGQLKVEAGKPVKFSFLASHSYYKFSGLAVDVDHVKLHTKVVDNSVDVPLTRVPRPSTASA